MSYRNLEIWQSARELTVNIHNMTLQKLPKFEMFEEAPQIRRSMNPVKSNIVEGYGRRRYKQDFIRFLVYTHASCDETIDHLETLFETKSLSDEPLFRKLHDNLNLPGGKLNRFIQSIESQHQSVKENPVEYEVRTGIISSRTEPGFAPAKQRSGNPASRIPQPETLNP